MKFSRHFRAFWLAAFALLAFAQALHVVEHLDLLPEITHAHHGHGHDHPHEPTPVDSSDSSSEHSHLAEHSHSPAIVDSHSFRGDLVSAIRVMAPVSSLPESPVWEIEYPPQLS